MGRGDPGLYTRVGSTEVRGLARTYADVAVGELLALIGSHGYLEIAVRQGSAALATSATVGSLVTTTPGGRR